MKNKLFILLAMFFLFSNSYADSTSKNDSSNDVQIIHNVSLLSNKNKCIYNDYYFKNSYFYYRYLTSPDITRHTSGKKYATFIISGYQFDDDSKKCSPEAYRILNLTPQNYYFLLALSGLLVGLIILVSSVYLVLNVGGKK